MEAVKHGYEENRRILTEGLPKAGLDKFLPVDGAFYLYADISKFSDDSLDFAKRMLNEAGVAATPGIDFDPVNGHNFLRFCYAGSAAEMHEAVERIGNVAQALELHIELDHFVRLGLGAFDPFLHRRHAPSSPCNRRRSRSRA